MSSPLTLIVLGQAYFFGSIPNNATPGVTNEISPPNVDRPQFTQNEMRRADYNYTPGIGSHKVHTEVTQWVFASEKCHEEGAYLAVINSRAEADVIAKLFDEAGPHANSYSPDYAWIGTHDLISQRGDYETIFGESLEQAGFEEWHDEKSRENPHCGAVYRDGGLSWFGCSRNLGFVCELPEVIQIPTKTGNDAEDDGIPQAALFIRESIRKKLTRAIASL